jgi:hypothetical protein
MIDKRSFGRFWREDMFDPTDNDPVIAAWINIGDFTKKRAVAAGNCKPFAMSQTFRSIPCNIPAGEVAGYIPLRGG